MTFERPGLPGRSPFSPSGFPGHTSAIVCVSLFDCDMDRLVPIFDSDALPIGILVLILVEALVLYIWQRRRPDSALGRPNTARIVSFLGAGGSLVAAMIFHRRPEPSPEGFAIAMLSAMVIHLWHIAVLLRR